MRAPMFAAFERAGHGRRLVIADRSLDIPSDEEVVEYGGSSANALDRALQLLYRESQVTIMFPDPPCHYPPFPPDLDGAEWAAYNQFGPVLRKHGITDYRGGDGDPNDILEFAYRQDGMDALVSPSDRISRIGFYPLISNVDERRLFVRTEDPNPYACATFVIGHAQHGQSVS